MAALMRPGLIAPDDRFAIIKFIEEPPKHIFVEKWFDVGISIHMPRAQALSMLESTFTVQLKPHLYRYTYAGEDELATRNPSPKLIMCT